MFADKCTAITYTDQTPKDVAILLETLAEEYPIYKNDSHALRVSYLKNDNADSAKAIRTPNEVTIYYHRLAQAARLTGAVMAGLVAEKEYSELSPFHKFGFLICASHGKVFTVEHVIKWMRRLAVFGYNQVLLYTDDTYELEEEPFFGYLRGRYTPEEIRAIDRYASRLGMELIPAIQTLGHLSQWFQWPVYQNIRDTSAVARVDEPSTYKLFEKIIAFWRKNTHCTRIHLGMDEAHDLGRGVFLDKNGYEPPFAIFNRHLSRMVALCQKYAFEPIIWSDMYFRMGSPSGQDYYDPQTVIPENVKAAIPAEVTLSYWDYYHNEKDFYLDWISRHRSLNKEPIMASGVWNWGTLWHNAAATQTTAGPCIEASQQAKLREILFTTWGDDGSYCDFDSAFAGFAFCAEKAFSPDKICQPMLEKRFAALTGSNYALHHLASELCNSQLSFPLILWDNPVYHAYLNHARAAMECDLKREADRLTEIAQQLIENKLDTNAGDLFHVKICIAYLAFRLDFARRLFLAWENKDHAALQKCMQDTLAGAKRTEDIAASFRQGWMACAKPFGLEVVQLRCAGVAERFRELSRRLEEYLTGNVETLPELDANLNPPTGGGFGTGKFSHLFTPCVDNRI